MTGSKDNSNRKLIDRLVPKLQYGPRLGLLGTTYEFDPEFFEIDFLPTLLELGVWDDRSWSSRIGVEKALAELEAATILTDARCYRGRPHSLRVELQPIDIGAGAKLHAKLLLIVYEQAVRLVVGSANLTENGFRKNREVAAVIEATPNDSAASLLIQNALVGFDTVLGRGRSKSTEIVLALARQQLDSWSSDIQSDEQEWFQWSGGTVRLWREFLGRWPRGEPVERITVVSPFWSAEEKGGPIALFLKAVSDVSGHVSDRLVLRLLTEAKMGLDGMTYLPLFVGDGLPHVPTDTPSLTATAHAVDPNVSKEDVDMEGFSVARSLHAKVLLMEGRSTALAYMGSANFSRRGWGFGGGSVNIEAGLVVRRTGKHRQTLLGLIPDTVGEPVLLTGDWAEKVIVETSVVDNLKWPSFILSARLVLASGSSDHLDLEIEVNVEKVAGDWSVHFVGDPLDDSQLLIRSKQCDERVYRIRLEPKSLERLLREKEVLVRWWLCQDGRDIPVNVAFEARDSLPLAPGVDHPGEALLIEYYQGRISFEELFPAPSGESDGAGASITLSEGTVVDTSTIQSYQIRKFVEALPGIIADLASATTSDATMRLALLGPVSPLALAREVSRAVTEQRRTAVAAGFQLVEILGCLFRVLNFDVPEKHAENWNDYCKKAITEVETLLRQLKSTYPEELIKGSSFVKYEKTLRRAWSSRERIA
jgi:phosphatidylserine/phosphatidylglycerophosphate/cardiolipin synthase-like enzyme